MSEERPTRGRFFLIGQHEAIVEVAVDIPFEAVKRLRKIVPVERARQFIAELEAAEDAP